MKVAVITPYYRANPDWLRQCHDSVMAQTHPCTHFLIADGTPLPLVDDLKAQHIVLPVNHADYGDTPRAIGSILAISQGYDAIAYLDADNWYDPEHIAGLLDLHRRSGAAVCVAGRRLHRLDGTLLGPTLKNDGVNFADTSCYLLTRAAFAVVPLWYRMDPRLHAVDDRVIWLGIKRRGLSVAHASQVTVAYRTAFRFHYEHYGEEPPPGSKSGADVFAALQLLRAYQRSVESADAG